MQRQVKKEKGKRQNGGEKGSVKIQFGQVILGVGGGGKWWSPKVRRRENTKGN